MKHCRKVVLLFMIALVSMTIACQKEQVNPLTSSTLETPLIGSETLTLTVEQIEQLTILKDELPKELHAAIDAAIEVKEVNISTQSKAPCYDQTQSSITTTSPCHSGQKPNIHFWVRNLNHQVAGWFVVTGGDGFSYQNDDAYGYNFVDIVDAPVSANPYTGFIFIKEYATCTWRFEAVGSVNIGIC